MVVALCCAIRRGTRAPFTVRAGSSVEAPPSVLSPAPPSQVAESSGSVSVSVESFPSGSSVGVTVGSSVPPVFVGVPLSVAEAGGLEVVGSSTALPCVPAGSSTSGSSGGCSGSSGASGSFGTSSGASSAGLLESSSCSEGSSSSGEATSSGVSEGEVRVVVASGVIVLSTVAVAGSSPAGAASVLSAASPVPSARALVVAKGRAVRARAAEAAQTRVRSRMSCPLSVVLSARERCGRCAYRRVRRSTLPYGSFTYPSHGSRALWVAQGACGRRHRRVTYLKLGSA